MAASSAHGFVGSGCVDCGSIPHHLASGRTPSLPAPGALRVGGRRKLGASAVAAGEAAAAVQRFAGTPPSQVGFAVVALRAADNGALQRWFVSSAATTAPPPPAAKQVCKRQTTDTTGHSAQYIWFGCRTQCASGSAVAARVWMGRFARGADAGPVCAWRSAHRHAWLFSVSQAPLPFGRFRRVVPWDERTDACHRATGQDLLLTRGSGAVHKQRSGRWLMHSTFFPFARLRILQPTRSAVAPPMPDRPRRTRGGHFIGLSEHAASITR